MKRKALALVDSGIMPVSRNEEPGVLSRQSSNSSSVLPFKKRYYMLYPHAHIHPERSFSNENESKTKDVVPVEDTSQIDLLRKTSSSLDSKPPINSASVIGSNGDKGKQVVGASEQEFSFPISSIHPTLRYKSVDVLRHSLGSTFEANVVKSEVLRQNLQSIDLLTKGPPELLDIRDVDAVQEHGHLRSLSSRESPPDQVFTRTNRRVETLDHQERADGRFPELHSGERTDKRRKYGKGRGESTRMRNVEEQEEFDVSRLKKRRF